MKTFINMLRDNRGASAAEYALILAIIGAVIAIAALGLADLVELLFHGGSGVLLMARLHHPGARGMLRPLFL